MSKRVLIVDDEADNRELLVKILGKEGWSPKEARNGHEALELIRSEKFDLVLMDLMMPGMDGFTAIEQIKALQVSVPVIVISAVAEAQKLERAKKLGVHTCLIKPFKLFTLLETLRKVNV